MRSVVLIAATAALVAGCAPGVDVDAVTTSDALYAADHVPVFRLHLSDDAVDALGDDPFSYMRGDFEYAGTVYTDVGIRLKGSASFRELDDKPAFKIKLNRYVRGQRFLGLESLTLNNMVQDDSFVREYLAYTTFRAAGVPAPRAGFAEVYLNGQLLGLYANIESIDDRFLARRFADGSGPLYEGDFGDDLRVGDIDEFELDEGDDPQRALLRALAEAVDGDIDALFWADDTPLDAWEFLVFTATEAAVGHWDGYRRSHNYRVYYEPTAGAWSFIPWGTDQTFHRDVDPFAGTGRVSRKCKQREDCVRSYVDAVHEVATLLEVLELDAEIERVADVIGDALTRDTRAPSSLAASDNRRDEIRRYIAERPADLRAQTACFHGGESHAVDLDGDLLRRPACPCPSVWIDGAQFLMCESRLTWGGARDWCRGLGLELAAIDDADQNAALHAATRAISDDAWYIGLSSTAGDDYAWPDGSAPSFDAWSPGEPSNTDEDCVLMRGDTGRWRDTACGQWRPFVCR